MLPPEPLPKLTPAEQKLLTPYLTPEFQLTAPLEIRDELTGFGTFFGTVWRIETNGDWTIKRILAREVTVIGKGTLTRKQIYLLAKRLAVYDPLSLPDLGRPVVNPHELTVFYGPKTSLMTFGVDQMLPVTRLDDLKVSVAPQGAYVTGVAVPTGVIIPPLSAPTRYAGIEWAVRELIKPNLGVKMALPDRLRQLGHPE